MFGSKATYVKLTDKDIKRIEKNENNLKFIKQFWDKPIKNKWHYVK